jgi:hypothetical protein
MDPYKRVVYNFDRRSVFCSNVDDIWTMDLLDFSNESGSNNGYFLLSMDVFSRYAWGNVLKTKTKNEIDNILNAWFEDTKPKFVWTDQESAFIHSNSIKKYDVKLYHTNNNPHGAFMIERLIRTIKEKLEPIRDKSVGRNWKSHIQGVINEYNNSVHSAIKMTPKDAVLEHNKEKIYETMLEHYNEKKTVPKKPKLEINDEVVTVKEKARFEKGYKKRWNTEKMKIVEIIHSNPPMYKLNDNKTYYKQQLQKC